MLPYAARTPFGARTLSPAQIAAQKAVDATPSDQIVHKWTIFRDISTAKATLGLSDRALAILDALLSFHPDATLSGTQLVVWPSNAQLCLRAHGIAEPTLRRHLALLVEAGVIVRRDSPNGKRYARKGLSGDVDQAFGFDLAPLVARAGEFKALADTVRAEERTLRLARERVTICRRDIVKLLAAAADAGMDGAWEEQRARYRDLMATLPRAPRPDQLETLADALSALADCIYNGLETQEESSESNGNAVHSERHIQNSNPKTFTELEPAIETMVEAAAPTSVTPFRPKRDPYPLPMVLEACPDMAAYARDGIENWRQFEMTAALVRSILGISPSAYAEAETVLGSRHAAIAVAAMLQRAEAIKSAGGYLRALVAKARDGKFSIGPMLMALISTRNKQRRA